MRTKIYLTVVLAATINCATAQSNFSSTIDSLQHFNANYWTSYLSQIHPTLTSAEQAEFLQSQQQQYIKETYFSTQKNPAQPPTIQAGCTNIDFESGNLGGWTLSQGYHPLYNASGCCPTAGGAQAIMSGNGVDPCGGFPLVAPGGVFSVRLGNNGTGGFADQMEQKFTVSTGNANFTYKYAVVLQDPGHATADQPSFRVEMFDTTGAALPCTFYNVTAGQGIPGFQNSNNCPGVIYKAWTTVVCDLTAYIGQNITIRFTTYDCALGGHYGYAYIDGSCNSFNLNNTDTICLGGTTQLCAPGGFATYKWNGTGVNGITTQCATASNIGTYFVQTTLVTGCPGPTFNYTVYNHPQPTAMYLTGGANPSCTNTINFTNASTATSYTWNFGDGGSSTVFSPSHAYANPGTYSVTLTAVSNRGCVDVMTNTVVIHPTPVAAYVYNGICQGAPVTFTNNSNIQSGTITQHLWNFGDGTPVSTVQNPTHIYGTAGTYSVTLSVTSNQACGSNTMQVITVNAKPNVAFTSANVCFGTQSNFNNTSTISSGTIAQWFWDLNGDGTIDNTMQNPVHSYTVPGTYSVSLTASSNANCINSYSTALVVHPMPTVNIAGNNVCQGALTSFTNQSSINGGGQITSYNWNLGNGTNSTLFNPQLIYPNPGTYTVTLNAISNNNCSNTNSVIVNVNANPVVNFTTANLCLGNTNSFANNSNISNGTITNWIWDLNGDGNADSTSQHPTYLYQGAGTYSVSLTAISNANCIKTYSTVVTVHPLPNVSFTANNTCQGGVTSYSNQTTITNGNQIASYTWNLGGGYGSFVSNPQISYPNIGNYVVSLTAVSNNNCSNTNTASVSVYANPNVNFASTTTCLNQATQFTNNSTIAAGNLVKYRWDFDGNNSWDDSTNVNPGHIYPSFGTMNCRLNAISNFGCSSIKTNPVIVHANPVANFKTHSTCLGDVTNFSNLSTSADGNITSYTWDFNGDNVGDNISASPGTIYPSYGVFMTRLEVQTEHGCVNVMTKSVYVNPKPIAQFTAFNKIGCPSLCTEFKNSSYIANGSIVTNQWLFGDNSQPSYLKNPTHCYGTGNYNVTLKVVSDSGCITTMNIPNLVQVYPGPVAGFDVSPEEVSMDEPVIQVANQSQGANSIQYYISDGANYTKENFTHIFNVNEAQKMVIVQIVKNNWGCADSLLKVIEIKPSYAIYVPNTFTPNGDNLNDGFKAQGYGINNYHMWIFDRWGKIVFETKDMNTEWDGTVNGTSEPIKNDVYVWKIQLMDALQKSHAFTGHVTLIK
jgi:gliding motility-associated-like protein